MTNVNATQKNVAIVGTGIAGLTCAYLLHHYSRHNITVYEAESRLGGHTATIDVDNNGEQLAIDTGFIVFNDWTYPNFIRLLDELGVPSQATDMSFSVSCAESGLEYCGSDLNGLFAQRGNIVNVRFLWMLRNILRFNRQAVADLDAGRINSDATLGEYLQANHYQGLFVSHYLVPMCAAIWSASFGSVLKFPLLFFVRFFKNHGLLSVNSRPQWRVIEGGSSSYLGPLVKHFKSNIQLATPINVVARSSDGVTVINGDGRQQHFDEVVLACHSDQALQLLSQPTSSEQRVLSAIPYQDNDVVLHTDKKLLPKNTRAWAAWNYLLSPSHGDRAVLTYNMNILQDLASNTTYCVTLNATEKIDPNTMLGHYTYAHPIFSQASVSAQERWGEINGVARTWYCGAYWGNGFHEDGVNSGIRVAKALGAKWNS